MGTPDIFIEHKRGEKVQKILRLDSGRKLFVIGSSQNADLRIIGEGVTGCHVVLRHQDSKWLICDVSGTELLRVNGEVVTEHEIDEKALVEIAGHRIQLFAKERNTDLFRESTVTDPSLLNTQQVVVRARDGKVLETHLMAATGAFIFHDGEREQALAAPTSGHWVTTEVGSRKIQQRLVRAQETIAIDGFEVDRDMKRSIVISLVLMFMLLGSVLWMGHGPQDKAEVALDRRSMDMIFDAKTIKKKRDEARKVVRERAQKAAAGGNVATEPAATRTAPEDSTAPKVTSKATAAVTSLRQAGLQSLIGKIAKRANRQGMMVAATGVSADASGAGRAVFSTGTSLGGGGGSAGKEGPAFRLGGVATSGKAGGVGVGNLRGGSKLVGGSVGMGGVVALSDDDQTVIEGGLDKDVIADVIKRNLGQIRYCYERQLSSNPELYGKVLVKFTIDAGGIVGESRVDASTLKSQMVEGCILRRMASWKFPNPKGGTLVHVAYPFLFKALD